MKATIELLKKQHDVLVDVIVWMDQNKKSNTEIRSKVDTILNFEKELKPGFQFGVPFEDWECSYCPYETICPSKLKNKK